MYKHGREFERLLTGEGRGLEDKLQVLDQKVEQAWEPRAVFAQR